MHQVLWYAIPAGTAVVLIVWAVALRAPKLPPRPSIPEPDDNAWDYMARAAEMVWKPREDLGETLEEILAESQSPPPGRASTEREAVLAWALGELRRGLYKPCRLPDGVADSADFLQNMVGFSKLLSALQAEISTLLAQGAADAAIVSARDILRVGRNLFANGGIMPFSLGCAFEHTAASAMAHIAETGFPTVDALREFVAWNEANRQPAQSLSDALLIDHYDAIADFEGQQTAQLPLTVSARIWRAVAWPFQRVWLNGRARKLMEIVRQVSQPYPEWGSSVAQQAAAGRFDRLLMGHLYGVACRWANADAERIGLSVRCALEAYRAERGKLPDALQELEPDYIAELPKDPISGDDFIYRVGDEFADDGYILYSVALDGEDDGGLVWSVHEGRGDLVFGPRWETMSGRGALDPAGGAMEWMEGVQGPG